MSLGWPASLIIVMNPCLSSRDAAAGRQGGFPLFAVWDGARLPGRRASLAPEAARQGVCESWMWRDSSLAVISDSAAQAAAPMTSSAPARISERVTSDA